MFKNFPRMVHAFFRTNAKKISLRCVFTAPKEEETNFFKVTICGAAGPVGRTLAHHLIFCRYVEELVLHDTERCVCSIAIELNHIPSCCLVNSYKGYGVLPEALKNSKIVVCADGMHSQYESETQCFLSNAERVRTVCTACAEYCPEAIVAVLTEPLNSMYPIAFASFGCNPEPSRLLGVTSLDIMRTNSMVANMKCLSPHKVAVPVVGGRSAASVVPVLSQTKPKLTFEKEEIIALTESVRLADSELDNCAGKIGLCAASAAASFIICLCKAINGADNIIECCMTQTDKWPGVEFLALPCKLGPEGVQEPILPELTDFECCLLHSSAKHLQEDIERGINFLNCQK